MALSLSRLGFQHVLVTQFNLSIKLLKGKWQSLYKEIREKKMSFLKKQFKRHFQKNVSNFLSLWSSLTSITDLCIQSWVSYTAEIPKA